jgi:hypothetical protein
MLDLLPLLPGPPMWSDGDGAIHFASPRWTKYFTRWFEFKPAAWQAFGYYLCRHAREAGPSGTVAREVEVTLITQPIAGTPPDPEPLIHRTFSC